MQLLMNSRSILVVGSLSAGLGVAAGAFGAHWLESAVEEWGLDPAERASRLDTWDVAVRYQMYHAFGLIALGLSPLSARSALRSATASCFLLGTLVFCGCLYVLVLSGLKILGAIVPIGGLAMIVGWVLFAVAAGRTRL